MAATAGSSGSWALIGALAAAVVAWPACVSDKDTDPTSTTLADLLADLGPLVVEPAHADVIAATEALVTATAAWAEATGDGTTAREQAQQAWRTVMAAVQRAELMQLGPAGSALTTIGGEGLRDELYSWPTVNPCRVDQETIEAAWDSPTYFEDELVNSYGLDALEYLLFEPNGDNDCPIQVPINGDGTWAALGPDGVAAARAEHAQALAVHVHGVAQDLLARWQQTVSADLAAAATDESTTWSSSQEALQEVFRVLFYLETATKDAKVGLPLGVIDCTAPPCAPDPELVESRWAGASAEHVAANLLGFRAMFTGGAGVGLDDLLVEAGHDELVSQMTAALDAADTAATLDLTLSEALVDDPASAQALYDALKAVTDLLKQDIATALLLQVPEESAGDND
jgi:predicted lipoprotein